MSPTDAQHDVTQHDVAADSPQDAPSLPEAKAWLRTHLAERRNPFNAIGEAAAAQYIETLPGLDPVRWAKHWLGGATKFAAAAERAEADGGRRAALENWWQAYQFAFLGRYPSPLHPAKLAAYEQARTYFARVCELEDTPVERVSVPFEGREGEGDSVTLLVARPPGGSARPPVVLMWGGIDVWKEESYARGRLLRERGFATVHLDKPGIGQSPVLAGPDAERQWDPVFDWLQGRDDLDGDRVAALGLSFGGYWAMKLAHTHRERLAAAVNWGGGVHLTFQPEWQEKSRHASSYLMDLMPARARIFGGSTFADYVARCPELSLLDQGVLDRESCPLLLVNGKDDQQNAAADIHLALEHGDPKTARLFPGGHMGSGPVLPTIADWLADRLGPTAKEGN
ncbi:MULTISPECIES: alpha/beta hydrolase family protein [Streptomyces violaceusniger group]|uniref:alpha/beta hydrolase family protein n=1 Tax=Streptomyces violaceusniger group TaxID=2839105 RepID=UPI001ABFDFC6|nr:MULTISPECIES: alpha/beta fold hydrolase [Streptomyces violaceusniger group]